jgi:hypothetical protein
MNLPLSEFCRRYEIPRRKFYKLIETENIPPFMTKTGDRWFADPKGKGAAAFIKEHKEAFTHAGSAEPKTGGRLEKIIKAREDKAVADAKIKQFKAEQEEIKTKTMIGEYVDVGLMRYYFSFFQRGISDSFAAVKKISPDLKRLYAAGKDKEAEKVFLTELGICFSNAVRALEDEMARDGGKRKRGPNET